MNASNDFKEQHGSNESQQSTPQKDHGESGHSGHGSASALARFRSQRREWIVGREDDEATDGGGQ
jgi:hypothetical protein